jgi:hypothetical protein
MKKRGTRTILGGYLNYNFRDHDPVLDQIDRVYELAGMLNARGVPSFSRIAEISGIREGTLRNWRMRKTQRPQHAAAKGVLKALGADMVVVFKGQKVLPGRLVSHQDRIMQRAKMKAERVAMKRIGRGKPVQKRKAAA